MSLCEDFLPQKLRSPPLKPPRRRHSDQSAVFLSNSRSTNRRKQFTGSLSNDAHATDIAISGSESLPSNWVSESPNNKLRKERQTVKCVDHGSPKGTKLFSSVSSREKNDLGKLCSLENNKLIPDISTVKCSRTLDQLYITKPNLKLADHIPKKEISSSRSAELTLDSNNCSLQVGDSVILHRRHHSDPVLSNFSNSILTVSNGQLKRSIFETSPLNCCFKDSGCAAFLASSHFNSSEIKIQKEINDKLWHHLCLLQAQLDNLQRTQISSKNDPEYPSFAELLFDVYKAQKEKDDIMQERLKAALELRDSAVQELDEVLQVVVRSVDGDKSSEDDYDGRYKELEQFFHELETVEHPADILHHQHILLAYLYHAKESKIQQLSHALRLAEEERDKFIFKAKKLEGEICKLKNSNFIYHADEEAVFEIVNQRDSALAELKSLQAQILSHHTESYSSQIQLSDEVESNVHAETAVNNIEHLKSELNNLTQLLTSEVKKRQIAEASCLRLQRMLNFLLEKVNGLNIGVPV